MSVRQEYICVGCGTAHIEITDSIEPRIDTCPDCRGVAWTDDFYRRRERILDECYLRMKQGEVEYADKDVAASRDNLMKRDLNREMIEELYDLINYAVARIIQIEESD